MSTEVVLPPLGGSAIDATVSRWLKSVGDQVTRDEPLLEVSTDKVDTEIPAPATGILLEVRANEDEIVRVGDVVAIIGPAATESVAYPARVVHTHSAPPDATTAAAPPSPPPVRAWQPAEEPVTQYHPAEAPVTQYHPAAPPQPTAPPRPGFHDATRMAVPEPATIPLPTPTTTPEDEPIATPEPESFATPEPEPVATPEPEPVATPEPEPVPIPEPEPTPVEPEHAEPEPAEPADLAGDGYVTPAVRRLAQELGVDLAELPGSGVGGRVRKQDLLDAVVQPSQPIADPRRGTTTPLPLTRAARADLATETKLCLTAGAEADLGQCHRADGRYTGAILHAVAVALHEVADLNAALLGDEITYHDHENIGLVVVAPVGPLAPVIHDAATRTPDQLLALVDDLTARAASARLSPADLTDSTFTVYDDGASGLAWATPAISRPQVAALSIGRVWQRPVMVGDALTTRDCVNLTLSYDRRAVEPATAADFLRRVQRALDA